MNFGEAIEILKKHNCIARKGWNGKGMFLYYVEANNYPVERNSHSPVKGMFKNDLVPYDAYIAMKTAQNTVVPWLASQTDILANDWEVINI